jgi:tRNA pseudouridine55 synthase
MYFKPSGFLNIHKPSGITSFQVVAAVRKLLNIDKCGHAGTLDPLASGVLPVSIGAATKFSDYFHLFNKQYIADIKFGASYDTYDVSGTVLGSSNRIPSADELTSVLDSYVGEKEFTVPAFSAKQLNGKRAYTLAREGKITSAGSASMKINAVKLISYSYPDAVIFVECGKGTYIRSIIHNLGDETGALAAMSGLIRNKYGPFILNNAVKLSDIRASVENGNWRQLIISVKDTLSFKSAEVDEKEIRNISQGVMPAKFTYIPELSDGEEFIVTDSGGNLLALAIKQKGKIKLSKVFCADISFISKYITR